MYILQCTIKAIISIRYALKVYWFENYYFEFDLYISIIQNQYKKLVFIWKNRNIKNAPKYLKI